MTQLSDLLPMTGGGGLEARVLSFRVGTRWGPEDRCPRTDKAAGTRFPDGEGKAAVVEAGCRSPPGRDPAAENRRDPFR